MQCRLESKASHWDHRQKEGWPAHGRSSETEMELNGRAFVQHVQDPGFDPWHQEASNSR